MDMTRRGFVGAAFAAGVWGGSRSCATAAGSAGAINCAPPNSDAQQRVPPLLKFGVVSDVHVRLAADGRSLAAGYETDTLEKTFAYFRDQGVDVAPQEKDSLRLDFPAATIGGQVSECEICWGNRGQALEARFAVAAGGRF